MIIKGKLTKLDMKLIETAHLSGAEVSVKCGSSRMVGTETVKVHSEGGGDWYLFGGYCMWWGLIQANSFEDAYYAYLEEFVTPDDMPETEVEQDYGTWDGCGNWYSDTTTSHVVALNTSDYDEWKVELTEGGSYER